MALATIEAAGLPFEVQVLPFDYLQSAALVAKHIPPNAMRILGSDSLIGFISEAQGNPKKWDHTITHPHLVFVRMLEGAQLDELQAALRSMPPAVSSKFKYQIVEIQNTIIASSDIRKNVDKAYADGLIAKKAYDYIKQQSLYT